MSLQRVSTPEGARSVAQTASSPAEFPVREYIGAMAIELAQMARWDGDEVLARLLDGAAARAAESAPPHTVVETVAAEAPRPA